MAVHVRGGLWIEVLFITKYCNAGVFSCSMDESFPEWDREWGAEIASSGGLTLTLESFSGECLGRRCRGLLLGPRHLRMPGVLGGIPSLDVVCRWFPQGAADWLAR